MLSSITWTVDPEIFRIFGHPIRWYGLLWASALMTTAWIVSRMYKHEKLPEAWFEKLFLWVAIGLIIGARLGHCLFYAPGYYLSHPLEILAIWEGGLASHGGAIGMVVAIWLYSRRITKKSMIWALDRLVVGVALGATCIRLGNLFNHEIYGGPTDLPWGFRFIANIDEVLRTGVDPVFTPPSHPTQLYEVLAYLTVFAIGMFLYWKKHAYERQGLILGVSLIGIFLSRFLIEFLKHVQAGFELDMRQAIGIDMGQLLSLPFVIWGIWLVWNALRKPPVKEAPITVKKK
ncbi:prolipoprotein diacylglyceryl transferase [Dysgonomonas sp. 25]|uniref:prolipoprotein diacylglyceryl transferase n=1 Tax=Dysgonomonas sp. 25 TaxID=2302933 RepID=UPI0013D8A081|nr:prolipoprotein diacylglyceryl transferase [Dysgonomonas sp. 25]NDV68254.1 prolipoprotein diacylglyceryl transferase [Dysgonomonas sp. 25]